MEFEVVPPEIDERRYPEEGAERYVRRMAQTKAVAVQQARPHRPVLAADTVVVVDDHILGKPRDAADATAMLRLISGRCHRVLTGVHLLTDLGEWGEVAETTVHVAPLTEEEIAWYVDSGEPFDKAGAYAVQGLASRFVLGVEGSYSNVVGLPVALVYDMLREAGIC